MRGVAPTRADRVRRSIIPGLMCQGQLDFEAIGRAHLLAFRRRFAPELEPLATLQKQGLVMIEADAVDLTAVGWHFVRAVAMVFDQALQSDRARERYSRVV